jgi:NAD(P)-dependent dehydrogenase (short-subunit alcohol dehydrogenase family)
MEIKGSAALITGGSRGLGEALGNALSREGARVALIARGKDDLDNVVARIRGSGGEAHGLVGDLRDKTATHALVGAATALVGPLDIVVHNASVLGPTPLRLLVDTTEEALKDVLEVNLLGPFRLTRAVVGNMILRGRGLVLNVTSDASLVPYPRWGAYGVSKAALDQLGRIWGAEVQGTGVKLLTVDPGEMRTRMHAEAVPDEDPGSLQDPASVAERLLALIRDSDGLSNGERLELRRWSAA